MLTGMFRNRDALDPGPPKKEDMIGLLPSLGGLEVSKLGGSNFINWRITDGETGFDVVLQAGVFINQTLIEKLSESQVAENLTTPFYVSTPSVDSPITLVLTEMCVGGDLRSMREQKLSNASDEEILNSAGLIFFELLHLCKSALGEKIAYPDIKLTNFLVGHDGKTRIGDKKSFFKVDEVGKIYRKSGLFTTTPYAPPEYFSSPGDDGFLAEQFMVYQLGLALYEYIVIPGYPENLDEKAWCEKPLDFSFPIFNTQKGMMLKELIAGMTNKSPDERPTLESVQETFKKNFPNQTLGQESIIVNNNRLKTFYKYRTRDDKGRFHAISIDANKFKNLKSTLNELKGDKLKSSILDEMKSKIEATQSLDELNELKKELLASDEYKILNTSQGITTYLLQKFGKNTTSVNTLNNMLEEQESYILFERPQS